MLKKNHATARCYSVLEVKPDGKLTKKSQRKIHVTTNKGVSNSIYIVSNLLTDGSHKLLSLDWVNCHPIVSNDAESALLPLLLPYEKIERSMMKNHPIYQVKQIIECCNEHGIKLE